MAEDRTLAFDPETGDLDTRNSTLHILEGGDAVQQRVTRMLRTVMGEWKHDRLLGFPYFHGVFTDAPTIAALQALFSKKIRQVKGIVEVGEVKILTDNIGAGIVNVEWTATTIYGQIGTSESIPVEY